MTEEETRHDVYRHAFRPFPKFVESKSRVKLDYTGDKRASAILVIILLFAFSLTLIVLKVRWSEEDSGPDLDPLPLPEPPPPLFLSQYLVNTTSCSILQPNFMPEFYKELWSSSKILEMEKQMSCANESTLGLLTEKDTYILAAEYARLKDGSCTITPIVFETTGKSGRIYEYLSAIPIKGGRIDLNALSIEMFRVDCLNITNFGATIQTSEAVLAKLMYWQKTRSEEKQKERESEMQEDYMKVIKNLANFTQFSLKKIKLEAEMAQKNYEAKLNPKHGNSHDDQSKTKTKNKNYRLSYFAKNVDSSSSPRRQVYIGLNVDGAKVTPEVQVEPLNLGAYAEMRDAYLESETNSTPINVLLLGFDSVSKTHFYRSLPKTREFLEGMNFMEMRGFHSVAPNTIKNMYALLMGLKSNEVAKSCLDLTSSTSSKPCTMIWNQFENYITMFAKDSKMSLHEEFFRQPVNYFPYPFTLSVMDHAINRTSFDANRQCTSSESIFQHLLAYTKKFVKKFQDFPFFSFTFLAHPFRNVPITLRNYDSDLVNFLNFIKSSKKILESTLIMVLSDHGDESSSYPISTSDGYIERLLPLLYIRVPEQLQKNHPRINFTQILQTNSKRLTTPFDVHQTLLHTIRLSLKDVPKSLVGFQKSVEDRSSFFTEIPESRTCQNVGIQREFCTCNPTVGKTDNRTAEYRERLTELLNDTSVVQELAEMAFKELNDLVFTSPHGDLCEKWSEPNSVLHSKVIYAAQKFSVVLLRIKSNHQSIFEVRLKIFVDLNSTDSQRKSMMTERVGSFVRLDPYENSSKCLPVDHTGSTKIHEICYCKNFKGQRRKRFIKIDLKEKLI